MKGSLLDGRIEKLEFARLKHKVRLGRFFWINGKLDLAVIAEGAWDAEEDAIDADVTCSFVRTEALVLEEGFTESVQGDKSV